MLNRNRWYILLGLNPASWLLQLKEKGVPKGIFFALNKVTIYSFEKLVH